MLCPFCKAQDDKVVNSRTGSDGTIVKRRRECSQCKRRFTTYERIEQSVARVIKKDGGREDFSRQKLLAGLKKACYKRPIAMEQLEEIADEVELQLHREFDQEVPSRRIGDTVMAKLRELDHVAYIRFASVYREFKDVADFLQEADTVIQQHGAALAKRPRLHAFGRRRHVRESLPVHAHQTRRLSLLSRKEGGTGWVPRRFTRKQRNLSARSLA